MNMGDHRIEFQPIGRRGMCTCGETLLDCARQLGVEIGSFCGGMGKCKSCKIRVIEGILSDITPVDREAFRGEELDAGWRLACKIYPESDCRVYVPLESLSAPQRIQVEGLDMDISLDPPSTPLPA